MLWVLSKYQSLREKEWNENVKRDQWFMLFVLLFCVLSVVYHGLTQRDQVLSVYIITIIISLYVMILNIYYHLHWYHNSLPHSGVGYGGLWGHTHRWTVSWFHNLSTTKCKLCLSNSFYLTLCVNIGQYLMFSIRIELQAECDFWPGCRSWWSQHLCDSRW